MANTKTSVFNDALNNLGVGGVTIDTEVSVAAQLLSSNYDACRQEVLSQLDWPFATVVKPLVLSGNYTPPPDWLFAYTYPTQALAVWKVYNAAIIFSPQLIEQSVIVPYAPPISNILSYQKYGEPFNRVLDPDGQQQIILTNCQSAYARMTYDLPDPGMWDTHFTKVMAWYLASEVAMDLTGRDDLAEKMAMGYNTSLSEAKRLAATENNSEKYGPGRIIDSRS